jgi:hypothetical protein
MTGILLHTTSTTSLAIDKVDDVISCTTSIVARNNKSIMVTRVGEGRVERKKERGWWGGGEEGGEKERDVLLFRFRASLWKELECGEPPDTKPAS